MNKCIWLIQIRNSARLSLYSALCILKRGENKPLLIPRAIDLAIVCPLLYLTDRSTFIFLLNTGHLKITMHKNKDKEGENSSVFIRTSQKWFPCLSDISLKDFIVLKIFQQILRVPPIS